MSGTPVTIIHTSTSLVVEKVPTTIYQTQTVLTTVYATTLVHETIKTIETAYTTVEAGHTVVIQTTLTSTDYVTHEVTLTSTLEPPTTKATVLVPITLETQIAVTEVVSLFSALVRRRSNKVQVTVPNELTVTLPGGTTVIPVPTTVQVTSTRAPVTVSAPVATASAPIQVLPGGAGVNEARPVVAALAAGLGLIAVFV